MTHPIIIAKSFTFEASHVLPLHPGKCSRLHGHSWKLKVAIIGEVDKFSGFVADFSDLKDLVQREIIDLVDHRHLGEGNIIGHPAVWTGFYPSSENLVKAFARILEPLVPERLGFGVKLWRVKLKETCTSEAIWIPRDLIHLYYPGKKVTLATNR